jgi:hypothetical protein
LAGDRLGDGGNQRVRRIEVRSCGLQEETVDKL